MTTATTTKPTKLSISNSTSLSFTSTMSLSSSLRSIGCTSTFRQVFHHYMFVQIFAAESHAVFFCFVQYSVRMISGTGEYDADNKFG